MTEILGYKGIIVTEENYVELKNRFPDLDPPTPAFICCPYIPDGFTPITQDTKDGTTEETR